MKHLDVIIFVVSCILILTLRNIVPDWFLKSIFMLISVVCTLVFFGKEMDRIGNIFMKVSLISLILILIVGVLVNFDIISPYVGLFIVVSDLLVIIIMVVTVCIVSIKKFYKF